MNYTILSIILVIIISSDGSVSTQDEDDDNNDTRNSLIEYEDQELMEELRKRWLGGPLRKEDTISLLNQAFDLLNPVREDKRNRTYSEEATRLLYLITDDDNILDL